jgi:hypothetical protein
MRVRYVTRSGRAGFNADTWDYWSEGDGGVTVFEPSDDPQETGLFDPHGNKLFRVVDRDSIGFRCKPRVRVKALRGPQH